MSICEQYQAKNTPARNNESCYDMGLAVAEILFRLGFDNDSICAGMVCETIRFTKLTRFSYAEQVGCTLADLAHATIHLDSISYLSDNFTNQDKLEMSWR